jgi:hypothetical protein
VDAANDLALLKAVGIPRGGTPLPIAASRSAHLGGTVATIGFPDPSLQGFSPKVLAHGHQVNYAPSPRPSPIGWERVSAGRVRVGAGRGGAGADLLKEIRERCGHRRPS